MTITPEQQKILDEAKQIAQEANLDLSWDEETHNEFEQRYKDTQASFTKAQQDKIEMAKVMVEQNPSNIKNIPDEKVRNKIIKEKWGVETLEQLEYIYPDYAKKNNNDDNWAWEGDDLTKIEKLEREVKFMKLKDTNIKTKEAISEVENKYGEIIKTIPEFETKLQAELKFISEELNPKDRIEKAFRIVVNSNNSTADAFSIMQWINNGWIKTDKKEEKNKQWSSLEKAFKTALWGQ